MQNSLNKFFFTLGMLLLSVASIAQANPKPHARPKEELSIKLTSPDRPFRLNVGLAGGSIKVITYQGKEILVEAELNPDKKKPGQNANQNTNINTNTNQNINIPTLQEKTSNTKTGKYVSVNETDNTVRIGQVNPYSSINVLIKVPANTVKLNLSVAQGGEVSVKDISGETEVMNPNGPIVLTNISGSAIATTVTGNITVTFTSVTENTPMAFSTLTGSIDVTFPRSFKANLKMQSDAGILFSDFPIRFGGAAPKMDTVNVPTLYRININGKLSGKINGEGAEILLKNMNGNIYIRRVK